MKTNESKTKKTDKQHVDSKAKGTEPVATAETPDTESKTGTEVEGPDAPTDGEGCESVTVVIVCRDPRHCHLAPCSVRKNLTGVNAEILMVPISDKTTDINAVLGCLPEVKTERIILMTDSMIVLNPVTLGDVQVVKAIKAGTAGDGSMILNFNTRTPVLLHKSALEPLLLAMKEELPYGDIADTYFKGVLPEGHRPVLLGDWRTDPWLLPVVSKNPSIEAVEKFAGWKKFMHVGPESWSDGLEKYLEERFPES